MTIARSTLSALLLATAVTLPAAAQTVLPPDATVAGRSFSEWTRDYWRWALKHPFEEDPFADTSGALAGRLNGGPVFFLPYTNLGMGPVERSFTVRADRPLFVHVHGVLWLLPDLAYPDPVDEKTAAIDANLAAFRAAADVGTLFASINGAAVPDLAAYELWSGIFDAGPVVEGSWPNQLGLPPGFPLFPSASVGWYLMIDGLPAGNHVLRFGGTVGAFTTPDSCCDGGLFLPEWAVDVTANIRAVVPEPASWAMLIAGFGVIGAAARRRRTLSEFSA